MIHALIRRQCAVVAAAALGATACRGDPPNLVLLTVDTLRADRLACYGGKADVGASLCALGDHGIRYTWAFSTAAHTVPSVVSIMTSREPHEHGITQRGYHPNLDPKIETIATRLAAAGWSTGAFVANPILRRPKATAGTATSWVDRGFGIYDDEMKRSEVVRTWVHEREAEELTDAALAWVKTAREPWFLWVHYQDPHGPYWPPRADTPKDVAGDAPLPVLANESGRNGIPKYQVLGDARALATYARRYEDEIRHLDRNLARLVAGIDAIGPAGILLTADHGEAFGEDDYFFAHGHSLGIDQIRVPMFWRPARRTRAAVVPTPVSTLDAMPTLLAAAGLAIPAGLAGRVLPESGSTAPPADPARVLFAEHRLRIAAISPGLYYARDLAPFAKPLPDLISGGSIPPLPARSATLGVDGTFHGYESAEGAAIGDSEERVQQRLTQLRAEDGEEAGDGGRIDDASRRMLRALGYVQ